MQPLRTLAPLSPGKPPDTTTLAAAGGCRFQLNTDPAVPVENAPGSGVGDGVRGRSESLVSVFDEMASLQRCHSSTRASWLAKNTPVDKTTKSRFDGVAIFSAQSSSIGSLEVLGVVLVVRTVSRKRQAQVGHG